MSKTPLATVAKTGAKSAAKRTAVSLFSILAIFGSIGALVWAFSGPPPGCTPSSCPANPFKVDFTNSRVLIKDNSDITGANAGGSVVVQASESAAVNAKLRIDANEIQSSTGGTASLLTINPFGGGVRVGTEVGGGRVTIKDGNISTTGSIIADKFCIGTDCKTAWAGGGGAGYPAGYREAVINDSEDFYGMSINTTSPSILVDTCDDNAYATYSCALDDEKNCIDYSNYYPPLGDGNGSNLYTAAKRSVQCYRNTILVKGNAPILSFSGIVEGNLTLTCKGARCTEVHDYSAPNGAPILYQIIPQDGTEVKITHKTARDALWISQQPSFANNFTLIIRISDTSTGKGFYEFFIEPK